MGSLVHFNVRKLAELHGLRSFVETGTAQGDSLAVAATVPSDLMHPVVEQAVVLQL